MYDVVNPLLAIVAADAVERIGFSTITLVKKTSS